MSSRHHCCNVVETIFIDSEWNVFVIGLFPFTERVIFAMIKTHMIHMYSYNTEQETKLSLG